MARLGTYPVCGDDGDFRPGIIRWLEEIRTEVLGSEEHVLNMVTIHAQGMTYGTQSSFLKPVSMTICL